MFYAKKNFDKRRNIFLNATRTFSLFYEKKNPTPKVDSYCKKKKVFFFLLYQRKHFFGIGKHFCECVRRKAKSGLITIRLT